MKKMHVKRGDEVQVIAGKDRGAKGKVIAAFPATGKVIVEGVNTVTKHQKARRQNEQSGIIHEDAPIDASNVMRICSKCGKRARTGVMILDDGSKVRYCKKCKETFNE